ncbi:hypothetical protein HGRIS_009643 [Hohenbuehelia grisea]|uniref:Mitochondrial distribution and morphology protein 10 n=1 Tax=Hohenbuehelia grisea TaxID=104357 RepID=A0ABR3J1S5_9AGAR
MHPFAEYVLRSYYQATGWNADNLFSNFLRSSEAILDFAVPHGLHLSISKSPNAMFKTAYSMTAMPSLSGSVGYIFTSCDLDVQTSGNVRFKNMIDRFKVYDRPRRPEPKEEVWLAGERVDTRDYLLYGRFYLPTGKLDAVYATRISPTLQALVTARSYPPSSIPYGTGRGAEASNVTLRLQHDVGKWCSEYSWSADDGMWGLQVLHNFGRLTGSAVDSGDENVPPTSARRGLKRVDEEDAIEGGLKGRVSIGAEVYASAKEKSGMLSTGIRFSTIPDATPPSFQLHPPSSSPLAMASKTPLSQPPTTITAVYNPIIGHVSGAYAARVSRDLSLASRFDFNVYSYESEWTMGAEWWLRRSLKNNTSEESHDHPLPPSGNDLDPKGDIQGVVKARASTSKNISLMWEGRLQNMLVSLGVISNFSSGSKPIKAIGPLILLGYLSIDDDQSTG